MTAGEHNLPATELAPGDVVWAKARWITIRAVDISHTGPTVWILPTDGLRWVWLDAGKAYPIKMREVTR